MKNPMVLLMIKLGNYMHNKIRIYILALYIIAEPVELREDSLMCSEYLHRLNQWSLIREELYKYYEN